MMTFAQIRSLAVLEPEQADEQARIARLVVRIAGAWIAGQQPAGVAA